MTISLVIMGVSGCGKSSLAVALAQSLALPLIEGDDYHSPQSRAKMSQGIALTDADRHSWLDVLCQQLRTHPRGLVMTCSALKRTYRQQLRQAAPALRFGFLQITQNEAQKRVEARAKSHFFSTNLVASQFATLEDPSGEPGVLVLDATASLAQLEAELAAWLQTQEVV